jgi:hypothetical protein
MTKSRTRLARPSIKDAFTAEQARRAAEREAKAEAQRRQQEEDLANAEELEGLLRADAAFLAEKALVLDRRRYVVSLDHEHFRITAYFEAGSAYVSAADKRAALPGTAASRKEQNADSVAEALEVMALYLADENL